LFLIAEISSIFADGFVSIKSYSDFPERFNRLKTVFIEIFGDYRKFFVDEVDHFNGEILLKFKNFDNQEDLFPLLHKKIYIEDKDSVKLDANVFYIHDLVGSSVYQKNKKLGIIKEVLNLACHDIYVLETGSEDLLIPAVKEFIDEFDLKRKMMIISANVDLGLEDEN